MDLEINLKKIKTNILWSFRPLIYASFKLLVEKMAYEKNRKSFR
jgi:hypothetical protein